MAYSCPPRNLCFSLLIDGKNADELVSTISEYSYSESEHNYVSVWHQGYYEHRIQVDDQEVSLNLYTERSYEDFNLTRDSPFQLYDFIQGMILLCDVDDDDESTSDFLLQRTFNYSNCPITMVGINIEKRDEEKEPNERMRMIAETMEVDAKFMEISDTSKKNIEAVLQSVTKDMIAHRAPKPAPQTPDLLLIKPEESEQSTSKKCIVS